MNPIDIDIWSDVMCPWCAVGYARLEQALALTAGEIEATVRWMPFELNPDLPPEGKSQAAHLGEVYGRTVQEVAAMGAEMAENAAAAGFSMEYSGPTEDGVEPPEPMMWNTFEAHCLLRWTLAIAGPEAQTRLKRALFAAHFQERRNISDRDELLDIAAAHGLDPDAAATALADPALGAAITAEEQRARDNGISAVPTFVIAGRYILQGAQEPEQMARALVQIAQMEAAA